MPHNKRANFKAKWLAARGDSNEYANEIDDISLTADKTIAAEADVALTLSRVHSTMMSTALAAKELVSMLDDQTDCAGLEFGTISHFIDDDLTKLDMNTMARRFRDLYKIATARIGILDVALMEEHEASQNYKTQLHRLSYSQNVLQRSAIESLYIGINPTPEEIEDYPKRGDKSTSSRLQEDYYDLQEDFSILKSVKNSSEKSSQSIANSKYDKHLTARPSRTHRTKTSTTSNIDFN